MPNVDATTPLAEGKVATQTLPAAAAGPDTYEDCLNVLEALDAEPDIGNVKQGLTKVKAFFKKRIGQKKSREDRDGGSAVKTALAAGRTFQKYERKAIPAGDNVPFAP